MVYAISQERNLLIDNEVQRILQASMDKGEIAKMNVKDTSYLLQASVLGVVMLWLHKQDQSLKKLTELCIDQIIGINHGEEGEKEDAVKYAKQAHDGIQGSEIYLMEGCKHWPQKERPDEFSKVIKSFLSKDYS